MRIWLDSQRSAEFGRRQHNHAPNAPSWTSTISHVPETGQVPGPGP